MSWEEVKKINGDMSLSLDERMVYIYGMIPRGASKRELNEVAPASNTTVLNVSGHGMLYYAMIYNPGQSYEYNSTIAITIYIDESLSSKRIITITRTNNRAGGSTALTTDLASLGILEANKFDLSSNNITINGISKSTNIPILFSKSLRIVTTSNWFDQAKLSTHYYLFP